MRNRNILLFGLLFLSAASIAAAPQLPQPEVQAVLKQYCFTCQNQRAKTANLELDIKDLNDLENDVPAWEAVVRKLRTGMMPPKNAARPTGSRWCGRFPMTWSPCVGSGILIVE